MAKKLVILESPSKAKTVQKYLGSDYRVVASVGHIRDLAVGNVTNTLGVDIANDFAPIYEISPGKKKTVASLKKYVEDSSEVYLATDPDREGEAIAWHLSEVLNLDVNTTKRLEFHEVTYHAIQDAINNPRVIDMGLVSSQETRRILDRIIGFRLSQLLQRKIGSKSAGRVQSVVLKLIVDKQKEIDAYVEEQYYRLTGTLKVDNVEVPIALIDENNKEIHFKTLEEVEKVIEELKNNEIKINSITKEIKSRASKPVYTTSTLLQDASTLLRFDSKKTMKIAQSLYEGLDVGEGEVGLITYMRTDSVRVSPAFINKTKKLIEDKYGEDYVGVAKVFNNSKNNVQDAHEGIRPTDLAITPEMVEAKASKEQAKLYRLIYSRAVSSMMKDELYEHEEIRFTCLNYTLLATGDTRVFDGFSKELGKFDKIERVPLKCKATYLSRVSAGKLASKDGKTKGPSAYTEASLIDVMKKEGIGRPSTYASTLDLIKAREYVEVIKTYYKPTKQGELTVEKLDESFADIINVAYTAHMEDKLDEIALGKCTRSDALTDFYKTFDELYSKAKVEMIKQDPIKEDLGLCPNCGKALVKRTSRYGSFIACSGYPTCKYIYNDSKVGKPCPKCNEGKLVLRSSKFGKFYACSNYPKCDYHESCK